MLLSLATACAGITLETPAGEGPGLEQPTTSSIGTFVATENTVTKPYRLVGYYASWDIYNREIYLSQIEAGALTHLNYAFSDIDTDGTCKLGDFDADTLRPFSAAISVDGKDDQYGDMHGNFHQLLLLKQKYPQLKVLISIGGWGWSPKFSNAVATEEARLRFVSSCVNMYLGEYGDVFDGIDIDWEYPVAGGLKPGIPADKDNYTAMLKEFRGQMDALTAANGKQYLLTIAVSADKDKHDNVDWNAVTPLVDWINLMTYDYHGPFDQRTGFVAPLYGSPRDPDDYSRTWLNTDATVRLFLQSGVPADKLVVGVPFYGYAWKGTQGDGLFSDSTGAALGQSEEPGTLDYKEIVNGPLKTYHRYWDDTAKVPWLLDPATGIFITYEDEESLRWKVSYIRDNKLGGAMIWETGLDGGLLLKPLAQMLYSH